MDKSFHGKTSWSCPLDSKHGHAVNPNTHKAWFDLLETVHNKLDNDEDCIYAADEIGISPQSGNRECIIGGKNPGPQYQQCTGSKENITAIVTICADDGAEPPAVIFKGNALGYSKKGWTDGEIGIEWIKEFDKHTKAKANGCDHLLIVDGHNSHYTHGFLDEEHDKWEREKGEGITKRNFVTIYGCAHLWALTPGLIHTAFCKTGVWPFNHDIIGNSTMAPSKETSSKSHLPITPLTPMRIIASALQKLSQVGDRDEPSMTTMSSVHKDLEDIIKKLTKSSLSGLVSSSELSLQACVEHGTANVISPIKKSYLSLHNVQPQMATEVLLLAALHDAEATNVALKQWLITLHASNILNEMYCAKLHSQLAQHERKKGRKGKGKVLGDGLPWLLSGDEFYNKVVLRR
ncbi:hypothetical protein ID866_10657 [Astraeus odoratus]|nr:hypothetical protein ID866_10657 [Astraeus odoratus]